MQRARTFLSKGYKALKTKEFDWIHVYSGKPVPPLESGSYNYLIWDIIMEYMPRHLFIGKYYPDSFNKAQEKKLPACFIDFKKRIRPLDRIKPFMSNQIITKDRDFIDAACQIIKNANSSNILVWGAIDQLAYYKWKFPNKKICYAHRWHEQPDPKLARQYSYCDYLLTLTKGAAKRAFEQTYDLSCITLTIPNGVDINAFSPVLPEEKINLRKILSLPEDKVIAIFPSVLRRNKGTDYLLHWISYSKKHLPEIHFFVTGAFDKHYDARLYKLLKNSSNVTWQNGTPQEKMAECYRASDISLMPSVCPEGMPMCSLETLASGLPLICTKHGGFSDYIYHEYNGLLCNLESLYSEGLNAIKSLIESQELRNKLSKNSRAFAEKRLSRKKCLNNFNMFFKGSLWDIDNDLSL